MFRATAAVLILCVSSPFYAVGLERPVSSILDQLQLAGAPLHPETNEWIEKFKSIDLEDSQTFRLSEISGSTSISVKIQKLDSSDPKGYKARGSFLARSSAGNPNTEIAYFNLAAIFGLDHLFRPAIRYELGKIATERLRQLLLATTIKSGNKQENKTRLLAEIDKGLVIKGCLKAKKPDSARALEEINSANPHHSHPVVRGIQAFNPQPKKGSTLQLAKGYIGDEQELAREYSILRTFDAIFGQWDRHSGGNVGIRLDEFKRAHFYSTDNGGATLSSSTSSVEKTLRGVSRFDSDTIQKLISLYNFLQSPEQGYFGYTDPQLLVTDLGLYFELSPAQYVERLKRNIGLVLAHVAKAEVKYGSAAYFQ